MRKITFKTTKKWLIAFTAMASMCCLCWSMLVSSDKASADTSVTEEETTKTLPYLADSTANFSMVNGAYIRLSTSDGNNGIRYKAAIKADFYNANAYVIPKGNTAEGETGETVTIENPITEIGMLIGPQYLNADGLTIDSINAGKAKKISYILSNADDLKYIFNETVDGVTYKTFAGSIVGLTPNAYDGDFIGEAYYLTADGEYHYAEFDKNGANVRSISTVANAVINEKTIFDDFSNEEKVVVEAFSDKNRIPNGDFAYGLTGWTEYLVGDAEGLGFVVGKENKNSATNGLCADYGTESAFVYSYADTDTEGGENYKYNGGTLRSDNPFVVKKNAWLTLSWGDGYDGGVFLDLVEKVKKVDENGSTVWEDVIIDSYDNQQGNSIEKASATLKRAINLSHLEGKTLYVQFRDESHEQGIVFSDLVTNATSCPAGYTVIPSRDALPAITVETETITTKANTTVTLPEASAVDYLNQDISGRITVTLSGMTTGSVENGGTFTPSYVGTTYVTYSVKDDKGRIGQETIKIVVESSTSGNVLTSPITATGSTYQGVTQDVGELIGEQKVSMIVNIEQWDSLVMFNVRGDSADNAQWPKGLVMRLVKKNKHITISEKGHDNCIYGSVDCDLLSYVEGADFLLEYQVQTVVVNGEEYVKVRVWVQGEELKWSVKNNNAGEVGVESGSNAIYRKVSAFAASSLTPTKFHVSTHDNDVVTIKELRLDGTSCELPTYDKPTFDTSGNDGFITSATTCNVVENGVGLTKIGANSNEDYVSVSFKGTAGDKGAFVLNLTDTASDWYGGLSLTLNQDGFYVRVGNINEGTVAGLNWSPYNDGTTKEINETEYTIVYKLTYVMDKVALEVWAGAKGGMLNKIGVITNTLAESCDYDATSKKLIIDKSAFATAGQNGTAISFEPNDITVITNSGMNGTCNWTVTSAEKLQGEPVFYTFTSGTSEIVTVFSKVDQEYVKVTLKHNEGATKTRFGITIFGESKDEWGDGIILTCSDTEGMYLRWDSVGAEPALLQLNDYSPDLDAAAGYTIVYKWTNIYAGDGTTITALKLEVWTGVAGGTLTKRGLYGSVSEGTGISYNSDEMAFYFAYDADKYGVVANCELINHTAYTNGDTPCNYVLVSASKSDTLPTA